MHSGKILIQGQLGYASQDPWVFDGTVKQNILFGNDFDEKRYEGTIKLCCMGQDIESFEYGSDEFVGDRGTTLSGGQKARLNLARAIYRDADVYLFDDPLSAVDANVGKDLFER
jgi:ATP-binding cassette subfamily C (CFTR/MRP) protein 4